MKLDTIQAKVEICWNGLNCQIGGLTLANKSLNDISQKTIRKLQDFMCEEMQEVAFNVAWTHGRIY